MMPRVIDVDFRKWLTRPHWRFDMYWLADDAWGTWLWSPPGSTARRAAEDTVTFNHLNVKLVVPGAWWTAIWNDAGKHDLYVDIIIPASFRRDHVTMIDLDLDLVRWNDGAVTVDDEDEFALHQITLDYPGEVIAKAAATAKDLHRQIDSGSEPFSSVGAARMQEAAELAAALM